MEASPAAVAVIVVAAGSGSRLGVGTPKAFVDLAGHSILERALYSVAGMSQCAQLIVVAPDDRIDDATRACASVTGTAGTISVVAGGPSRQSSVAAGLAVLDRDIAIVLVHDAARALTPSEQFDRVVDYVQRTGRGAIPGLPVSDTIKRIGQDGLVRETVDRAQLSAVQTPQGFPREQLVAAYAAARIDETDDAALLAAIGHPVSVIDGDPRAFKITTAWDLGRAEQLLTDSVSAPRIGVGTDTHAFDADAQLWLAGLYWPGQRGLAGHSDGDAACHAITDALLSAAGLGDIGSVFGTSDPQLVGAHGDVFLRRTRAAIEAAGFRIGNVSVQIIGNSPRFAPRRQEAQELLSGILGAPVSVTATTTDALGFTGRGEGLAAIATALLTETTTLQR
jgi:2-C-methyl-D-erythritol 4-phosphate cytidylyltransferase/2-C-methyl-D-erythritol 2,4-cyclodiphosphate synthase